MPPRRRSWQVLAGFLAFATFLLLMPLACPGTPGEDGPLDEEQLPAVEDPGDAGTSMDAGPDSGPPEPPDAGPVEPEDAGPRAATGLDARPANPTCVAPERPAEPSGVAVQPAFPKLRFQEPLLVLQAPGDNRRIYVLEKTGRVKVFANDAATESASVVIDLSGRVDATHPETGLLGMAFHPRFATNGVAFLSFTAEDSKGKLNSYIIRYRSNDGGATLDPSSAETVLQTYQPYSNHNGGHIAFGADGFLYIGFGDGGGQEDPGRTAQNPQNLLGKMLRIDVDSARPYAIPRDNPFVDGGGRKEIYAMGFRNPWRWSFDRVTGALWLGDVGEKTQEEVDRVERGGNYGWSVMEGTRCLRGAGCDTTGLVLPVATYGRSEGVSVTAGFVYRGGAIPGLVGQFVFGDFGSGRIWSLPADAAPGGGTKPVRVVATSLSISSFGQLQDGELLVVDFGGGQLHRLVPAGVPPSSTVAPLLSKTGCVDPSAPTRPAEGLIPYGVNAPLWSDGADKERFLAVPDGKTVTVAADGRFEPPPGTVAVKTFSVGGRRVETRLFMRHPDGSWAGYSYAWNDEGTDANLLEGGLTKEVAGKVWTFPSRGECMQCHNAAAGAVLGLEVAQLNGDFVYPNGRLANQLDTLAHIGLLTLPESGARARLPAYDGPEPVEARARAYLHANCASCHRPGGLGRGRADLRFSIPLAKAGVCDVPPEVGELGLPDARLVAPGHPERSLVSFRMHGRDAFQMPPLATHEVDAVGTALVDGWISTLTGCPPGD